MKITALVTALTLGLGISGTAALAQPAPAPVAPAPIARAPFHKPAHRWTTLATASLSHGRAVIDVATRERFRTLSLDARGRVRVSQVAITFADGERQIVAVNQRLGDGATPLTIDLNGRERRIAKIVVVGSGRGLSSITARAL